MFAIRHIMIAHILVVCGLVSTLQADSFPGYSVDQMCDMADLIIEGTYLGKNRIRINKILKATPLLAKDTKVVDVVKLDQHSRSVGFPLQKDSKAITTKDLVVFLVFKKEAGTWTSIATIDADGNCGSCGLLWYDASTCYGYVQIMNPGPFVLVSAKENEWRIPKNVADLRADIKTGLANSREWRRSLAIKDPGKKAQALARYLLKGTTPKGDKGTYLYYVREPMAALGKEAVPTLIKILKTAPAEEKLNEVVLVLYDIGPAARPALSELTKLLAKPDRVSTSYVLSALGATGDPRAIPDLEKYSKSEDKGLAKDAEDALTRLRDTQAKLKQQRRKRKAQELDF